MARKNFSFRFEWFQAIAHLDPEQRLEIYEQTIRYASTGRACFQSGIAAVAFNKYILPDFERRAKAAEYRARRKARLAAEAAAKAAEQVRQRSARLSQAPLPLNPDFHIITDRPEFRGLRPAAPPKSLCR